MPTRNDNLLIHFDGAFSPSEKAALSRTVRAVERRLDVAPVPPEVGCPWSMVVAYVPRFGRYYIAHRIGHPLVLRARSVRGMIRQIESIWVQSVVSPPARVYGAEQHR